MSISSKHTRANRFNNCSSGPKKVCYLLRFEPENSIFNTTRNHNRGPKANDNKQKKIKNIAFKITTRDEDGTIHWKSSNN